ncbi:Cytochrome b5 domain-containing protein RLF [Golovinomyces cichoracearum]|uniref:Cytochrome b5 domain-containing protein RLF n=1 Tax=Golovinomyces cichoracearum TaxID=62708 RepID=A0A420J287_9PEZI|nr:Cytochrome b5 domain-containing protein RLF [Golovinomyces cichoracearum]
MWSPLEWLGYNRDVTITPRQNDDVKRKKPKGNNLKLDHEQDITITTSNDENNQCDVKNGDTFPNPKEISDYKAMPPPPLPRKNSTTLTSNNNTSANIKATPIAQTHTPTFIVGGGNNEDRYTFLSSKPSLQGTYTASAPTSSDTRKSTQFNSSSRLNQAPAGLAPSNQNEKPARSTKKVILKPGHSPLDWARLANSNADLSGLAGASYIKVPPSLLRIKTGRKGKDAWTVLGGKVYNITPYLPFHPGGEAELLRSAGRDGTKLFTEVHPWVNWEGMLASCLVGIAVDENEERNQIKFNEMD